MLDELVLQYHRREWVNPDPISFLYAYPNPRDREIAGLVASTLAYGRVAQILRSVSAVLDRMDGSPSEFLRRHNARQLGLMFDGFKHRWTTRANLVALLVNARKLIQQHGSLESGFSERRIITRETLLTAMDRFGAGFEGLIARPSDGSACKRFNLFLRWMVRCDAIDPGGWTGISPGALIVPVDTHMHRIALQLRLTRRKTADLKTALEITEAFGRLAPDDPVRYDFSLTRFGINPRLSKRAGGLSGAGPYWDI
ncbi:MAG TPA: TIGR02757 family protein [Verrucomicrobia bacterium]|nr:MAG: TIGR02757 family protein [Lentisphaerae bacterium GWF2_57_35]HBA86140.1 TIGR02757 family protein [Verrucomicrobiota bacterium]